jgi:hypothetical protein
MVILRHDLPKRSERENAAENIRGRNYIRKNGWSRYKTASPYIELFT